MHWFAKTGLILFLFFSHSLALAQKKENINLAISDHPPYIDQNAPNSGLITQIVIEAFKQVDVDSNLISKPWIDVEQAVDYDKHFSFMWTMNPTREKKWLFSDTVYRNQIVVIANRETKFYWQRHDQLRQYKLGMTKGHSYGALLDDYKQYLDYQESISDYVSLKHLVARQYDAIFIERLIGQYLVNFLPQRQQESIELIDTPDIRTQPSYLVCAKSYSKCFSFINLFNRGLKRLKASGRYNQILNQKTTQ